MQRDLSASAFNPEYAYENKNIRIMPTDESTLLSIINERGNKLSSIIGIGDNLIGTPIGQSLINNELIIFTAGDESKTYINDISAEEEIINDIISEESILDLDLGIEDRIYKIWFENGVLNGKRLFRGQLGFNTAHPIEAISFYENSDIRKVYWTDGLNQPRIINVAATDNIISKWDKYSFDFVRRLSLKEVIDIKKSSSSSGIFSPGVIQYAFTYFNKYGQESNIFYTSPLYYISYNDRGASPEDKVGNSFTITIDNIDKSFDYIRIYSIHRTSIDSTPTCRIVTDLSIPEFNSINYVDNGLSGSSIDPTELLYVGGEEVIFSTMAQKDNTLFLGDIKINRKILDSTIRDYFKGKTIYFVNYKKSLESPELSGYYPYTNQLGLNSTQIKTFKYLEYYRFGIQAQHYTGKWSEPIWINDVRNNAHVSNTFYDDSTIGLPVAEFVLNDPDIINRLLSKGYINIRPVIVYPTINDREVICQGILCPTVYNVSDRFGNSPFSQSSWYVRPNAPFDEYEAFHDSQTPTGEWQVDLIDLGSMATLNPKYSIYSRAGIMSNNRRIYKIVSSGETVDADIINKGAWAEFRHNNPIPSNNNRNAEIQCIFNPPPRPTLADICSDAEISSWVSNNSEYYYVDQSIITLHSPDIEFSDEVKNVDTSSLKLRIVGMVPITSFASDIDIETSTPVLNFKNSSNFPQGFYKEPIGVENKFGVNGDSHFGWRCLTSGAFWFDEIYGNKANSSKELSTGFVIYPWHRNGSLNNTKYATNGYKSSLLSKKRMSNIRYSYKSVYLDYIWSAYIEGSDSRTGISGATLFDSDEVSLIRIPAQKNSGLADINYYGNVDKVLTISRVGEKKEGYPIMTSGMQKASESAHILFSSDYIDIKELKGTWSGGGTEQLTDTVTGIDPVRIQYKSTPHMVIALNYTTSKEQRILPTIKDGVYIDRWDVNYSGGEVTSGEHFFWDKNIYTKSVSQDVITTGVRGDVEILESIQYGWLWLGELYNDNVQNRFGGQTEEAFENNNWLPCGEAISLIGDDNVVKNRITVRWTEGDTYYQRYDHIKTYPFTLDDQNQMTEIVSFMCETRVNIDGRYDRNRGRINNFAITPTNFNLLNNVYSQQNNFFNYRTINPNKLNLDNFHNSITWTKTKTAGELVDTWTNITLASTLDLDGDKGDVRAIRRFNNNLIAFQDKGISQILYNENMQVASTEGVPIEIANSGKVNGKRYLTDKLGCANKWSICETSNGIYFIDDTTKGIFLFNGKFDNLSDRLGLHSWINAKSTAINIWNPVDFNGFVTYYDKVNGDVFFISRDECLAFSEPLGQFTSFYSYESLPYFINLKDRGIAINKGSNDTRYSIWLHNEGEYNMFFNKYQPFYTTVIANPDMAIDKIFNNLEFRADSWKGATLLNTTFDTLTTWNEYQTGTSTLNNILGKPSSLKKKFRIWRANIPRDKSNGRDRMRNPWLYVKLSMEGENTNKTILHDMIVHYFE